METPLDVVNRKTNAGSADLERRIERNRQMTNAGTADLEARLARNRQLANGGGSHLDLLIRRSNNRAAQYRIEAEEAARLDRSKAAYPQADDSAARAAEAILAEATRRCVAQLHQDGRDVIDTSRGATTTHPAAWPARVPERHREVNGGWLGA